jgi:protocatechuate 3,4-dioxygenase beta subunit
MTQFIKLSILILLMSSCMTSQNKNEPELVGGPCQGCEAVFEYGDRKLTAVDTLPTFFEQGIKIKVTGTIYQSDGKTPAKDVIMYFYHTDQNGVYATKGGEKGWAKQHGYIRGWIKTGLNGKYEIYTIKPGSYPSRDTPAHIHPTILEPNGKYYWIGAYHFDGDPLLTEKETSPDTPRGGSIGLLKLIRKGDLRVGTRDIILGENISDYK